MGEPIHEDEIVVLFGCCCANTGIYCGQCLGCSSEETICCIEHACCFKSGAQPMWCQCGGDEGKWIQIGLGCCMIACVSPTTCCKGQGQLCCLVHSCALPPDSEIPATIACFGISCVPRCGFCLRLNQAKGGAPTVPDAMVQPVQPAKPMRDDDEEHPAVEAIPVLSQPVESS